MGGKDKKRKEEVEDLDEDDSNVDIGQEQEVDIEEQVQEKIIGLTTLREKVQAIALNNYLLEKRKLDKEMAAEIEAIERKFRETFNPFTKEINDIVSGSHAFADSDFQEAGELLTPEEQANRHNYLTNEKIAQYWLKVFTNSDIICDQVEERDEPLLKHLLKVEAGKSQDLKKLWIDFYFSENQWFTNTKIHKQFQLDDQVIKKGFGDQINWKSGKNITVTIVKKKNKKKGGQKKTKEVKQKSFFNFFLEIEINSDDDEQQKQEQGENVQDLQLQYQMAQHIYEDLIPKSLQFYLGVQSLGGFGDFDDDEEEEDDEDIAPKKGKLKAN